MGQPQTEELRYTVEAIEFMDRKSDGFYDAWLEAAVEHARGKGRLRVEVEDVEATLLWTLEAFLERGK